MNRNPLLASAFALATVAGLTLPAADAAVVTWQPDGTGVSDVFTYQFTATTNYASTPYDVLLGASYYPSGGGHSTQSYIRFDSLPVIDPVSVVSVTLGLMARESSFGQTPTVTNPVTVALYEAAGTWTESTLNWSNKPGTTGSLLDSVVVNSGSGVYTWDVTALFLDWLNTPASNHGVVIVREASDWGGVADDYGAMFRSSDYATASARPFLEIVTQVPEPASAALLALGAPLVLLRRRTSR